MIKIQVISLAPPISHWLTLTTMLTTITELPNYRNTSAAPTSCSLRQSARPSAHPLNGDIMEGTGGIRKLRWASGGVRIIYYYHDPRIPLYLLTVFGKNEKSNITKSERNELAKLVKLLVHSALERKT